MKININMLHDLLGSIIEPKFHFLFCANKKVANIPHLRVEYKNSLIKRTFVLDVAIAKCNGVIPSLF